MVQHRTMKQVVGIDMGMESFYACYLVRNQQERAVVKGAKSFSNNYRGMKAFLAWCRKREKTTGQPLIHIMEATGVYYENLVYFLYENEQRVSVQLAQKLTYFAKSNNLKTKTDKVDSKMIAAFGMEKTLGAEDLWTPPSKGFKVIRDLTREHTSLKKALTAAKSQLHAMGHAHHTYKKVITIKKQMISFYEKQLKTVEKELKKCVRSDEQLHSKITKIEAVKGLGFITIIKVIAETNGFLLFKNIGQLVSYSGMDVVEKQSGKYNGKTKISKKGNARIRSALYMPALAAARSNSTLKSFYERVNENRTIKKQGVVAVMRKLLILIYTLWKKDETYIENYQMC